MTGKEERLDGHLGVFAPIELVVPLFFFGGLQGRREGKWGRRNRQTKVRTTRSIMIFDSAAHYSKQM